VLGRKATPAAIIPNVATRNSDVIAQAMVSPPFTQGMDGTTEGAARQCGRSASRRKLTGERYRGAPLGAPRPRKRARGVPSAIVTRANGSCWIDRAGRASFGATAGPRQADRFRRSRNVRLWPAHKTRYVAPCRDNKDATFHRRHIAFAGKKTIGNNRPVRRGAAVVNGVAALAFAAASACIEPSGLYDRSGTPPHAVTEFLVGLALGPKHR
jgi:hypothetical protein